MDGDTGPANVKGSALATIAGASQPDVTAPPLAKPQSNRGGRRPGSGRKRSPAKKSAEKSTRSAAPAPAEDDGEEIDTEEAERINSARTINSSVDMAAVAILGEDMRASAKEAAQLDAALIEYQRIKGNIPVPIELVLITAYSTVYGEKLMRPKPKERLIIIWLRVRGAFAAVLKRLRRRT
jgi:hypothetical protein